MTEKRARHGYHGTRIHRIWSAMKRRCQNENHPTYAGYGALGIKVCDEWQNFTNFLAWALENNYTDGLTLDRLDPLKGYEPSNCRWGSYQEQGKNRRNSVIVTAFGETKLLTDWFRDARVTVPPSSVRNRLAKGMAAEEAFTKPIEYKGARPKPAAVDLVKLRDLYQSGASVRVMAAELGAPESKVRDLIAALGVEMGDRSGMELAKVTAYAGLPYVEAVLRGELTTWQAAETYGVSQTTVANKVAQVRKLRKQFTNSGELVEVVQTNPENPDTYELIKADVLSGMSGYAAAQKRGVDSLKYAKILAADPDIVAAKAAGAIKDRAKWKTTPEHYRRLPHVVDVLDNGMTQAAAAKKHGVSQPLVNRHVKQALGGQPMLKAKAEAPTNDAVPTADPEIDAIKALLAAYAARHQINYEQARNLLSSFSAQYQQQDKP